MLSGKTLVFLVQDELIKDHRDREGIHSVAVWSAIVIDDFGAACLAVTEALTEKKKLLANWDFDCRFDDDNHVVVGLCSVLLPGLDEDIRNCAKRRMLEDRQLRRQVSGPEAEFANAQRQWIEDCN